MSMVLKSGTRQLHATAWEFDRNNNFDAIYACGGNYDGTPIVPELRFNVFGFNVGGPISLAKARHKTFFFYNQEWRKLIQGSRTLSTNVPDPSQYSGGAYSGNRIH